MHASADLTALDHPSRRRRPRAARPAGTRSAPRRLALTTAVATVAIQVVAGAVPVAWAQPAPDPSVASPAPVRSVAPEPPAGTVLRVGRFAVDLDGRTLFVRGVSVPPDTVLDQATVARWAAAGFTAARLGVRMEADGTFSGQAAGAAGAAAAAGQARPPAGAGPTVGDGLDRLAASVATVTGQGLRVMIQIVPTATAARAGDEAFAAGLRRLSSRFRDVAGLVGFELAAQASANSPLLSGAVRLEDAHHLLWRSGPALFDPTASTATNDEAALLVGWAGGDPATVQRLLSAAESTQIGWFFDRPPTGPLLAALARPYPAAVAGVPVSLAYNPSGRLLALSYLPVSPAGNVFRPGAMTEIRVPAEAYPDGYLVRVSGATVVSAPGAGVVCLVTDAAAARVDVRVEPASAGGAPPVAPPPGDPCPAAGATTTAPGAATAPAGATGGGIGPAATGRADGRSADENVNGMLLWALPLAGATGMTVVLAGLWSRLRRDHSHGPASPRGE
ncbi:hypothetical protein [Protofrankia sp. BMG5.30]|uniref:hypothetical protein n=1 Tax=Protofrankia sp. BMG5.30 TaxID=1834514 RepID=UPI0011157642|nr:hypothetical protein [Protofrankia sp. BMG5.30]